MKVRGFDHIHLLVSDLGKARAFAETIVGGPASDPYGGEDWNAWASYHQRGGLDLFSPINPNEPILGGAERERPGVFILAFRVDNIDEAVDEIVDKGFAIVSRVGSEEAGYGKMLLQAQLERFFNTRIELCERGLPDDPLHCPIPDHLDHVEMYVNVLAEAVEVFTTVTDHPFPDPVVDERLDAWTTTNDLGLRLTQPRSPQSPVARDLREHGEGVHAVAVVVGDIDAATSGAQSLGLTPTGRYDTGTATFVEFDPVDFDGVTIKLLQRHGAATEGS